MENKYDKYGTKKVKIICRKNIQKHAITGYKQNKYNIWKYLEI